MRCRVFVIYATGDEGGAKDLRDALSRLENIKICNPERIQEDLRKPVRKIKDGLGSSHLVIALMTFNSTNTMWLNQEIGYACAKNIPIISVVEKGIEVQGFLEGQRHIVFQRGDFRLNIFQIISQMRKILSRRKFTMTHFKVACPTCHKKYSKLLPSQKKMDAMIRHGQKLTHQCKFCSATLCTDPFNLYTRKS